MAGFSLDVHRLLLPWKSAGVEYLLCDEATLAALRASCPSEKSPGNAAVRQSPRALNPSSAPFAQTAPRSIPARSKISAPADPAGVEKVPDSAGGNVPFTQPGGRGTLPAAEDRSSQSVPAAWRELREKKTPPHPRLVWTYRELAEDMSGRGGAERSKLWQRLIADLALPRGSNAFWPLAPLTGQPSSPTRCDPAFFFFGINAMRPRTVLLFCSRLPEGLALPPLSLFQPEIVNGVQYVLLHEPSQIAEDLRAAPSRYQQLVSFLKHLSG